MGAGLQQGSSDLFNTETQRHREDEENKRRNKSAFIFLTLSATDDWPPTTDHSPLSSLRLCVSVFNKSSRMPNAPTTRRPIRGIIFDLDGTLVDSALDFDAMRAEMGLRVGAAVLEAIADLPPDEAERCHAILHRHEYEGAMRAVPIVGAAEFVRLADGLGLHRALWTRNSRGVALATIERLAMPFEVVVARDDAPPKPDPTAVFDLCRRWEISPAEVVVVGDYVFDIEAGRRAGARTVLYTAGAPLETCEGHELADFHLASFEQVDELLRWISR